ncbi:class I SAM-dependent DNA methyltransferase [Streptomyces sp. NBC_00184]|uniref:Eco57I restriction-modification methylase domain-containing protein n=1 Tax=Streptomyces sp. NBC_00184 TaxID=2975673 RepID=UPI002E2A6D1D|nr:DNA methyltransferase [Streptomyces sp. NBC_00184]
MTFDSLVNAGQYFPSFYLDEILPKELKDGPLKRWSAAERQGEHTPRQGLRDLSGPYFKVRDLLASGAEKYAEQPDARAVAEQRTAAAGLASVEGTEIPAFQPLTSVTPTDDGKPETIEEEWRAALGTWHRQVITALGFEPDPGHLTLFGAAGPVAVPVAHSEPGVVVLTGGFADDIDHAVGDGHANQLPAPVKVGPAKTLRTVTDLAAWLLSCDDAPKYAVLLFGGVMVLASRGDFSRGRHLAVDLDTALSRKAEKSATTAGELDVTAWLFGAPSLRPREDGDDDMTRLLTQSRDHSEGVTKDLRAGLQEAVQLIANEVLDRARSQDVRPEDLQEWLPHVLRERDDLPRVLTTEALRYLYRILFLLYAEARPELEILPVKGEEYATGYSVARLRELVVREKLPTSSRGGLHFHESLALLFEKVFSGHPVATTVRSREELAAKRAEHVASAERAKLVADDGGEGVRIEALRSKLFDPESIELVGQRIAYPYPTLADGSPAPADLDLRLRNSVLHKVLRRLTLTEGQGPRGRGGFISYANLSINHLGSVYERLMSYTGFIAETPLYEVAKGGDPKDGSWLIGKDQVDSGRYADGPDGTVFVKTGRDSETGDPKAVPYPVGSYVYRLAGRDRQTSASYYTPESLTKATVEQTLRFRLDEDGRIDPKLLDRADKEAPELLRQSGVTAAEVLKWRVCEPALGSGAFLNEAVNQIAELYLKLAERERGVEIEPDKYQRELQKAKAYIALHNAYGIDLNDTAVELAEVSLWLNTMYPGMRAPWYGLHLHRGNSLVGAVRRVYGRDGLKDGGWLNAKEQQRPRTVPMGTPIPGGSVHQFLVPALGWGSIGEKVSLRKPKKGAADQTVRAVVDGKVAEWLDPELIERLQKWRGAMRRAPKGGEERKTRDVRAETAKKLEKARQADEEGKTLFAADLFGAVEPEQGTLDGFAADPLQLTLGAAGSGGGGRGLRAAKQAVQQGERDEKKQQLAQTTRLRRLAQRVEYLWDLVTLRLELSEQEIARSIDVWGLKETTAPEDVSARGPVMDRDAVREALTFPGTPYWRVKQVMDAWCALWFWPLEQIGLLDGAAPDYMENGMDLTRAPKGSGNRRVPLRNLEDWIEFAEAVVGRIDVEDGEGDGGQAALVQFSGVTSLRELDEKEHELDEFMAGQSAWTHASSLGDYFPWFQGVQKIARERGFFHWELSFAHVFADGGFDVMVGNPPWVRQEWEEDTVLAEVAPSFILSDAVDASERDALRSEILAQPKHRSFYLGELAIVAGVSAFLASPDTYHVLAGTRPDLYRGFMLTAWRAVSDQGAAGLIHPSTHLTGSNEVELRKAAYRHLRFHADFTNELLLFANPVGNSSHFSVNVYGRDRNIKFQHMSWLLHPDVLIGSVRHDGKGALPGVKKAGKWDLRPHLKRIILVNQKKLGAWQKLAGKASNGPAESAKLLYPVTTAEEAAIAALARWPHRLGDLDPDRRISSGFNEKTDRMAGYFSWAPGKVESWDDVILQGPLISVATPLHKQPPAGGSKSMRDYISWDHRNMEDDAVPRTNYRRAASEDRFVAAQDRWVDHDRLAQLDDDPQAVETAEADVLAAAPDLEGGSLERAVDSLLQAAASRPYSEFFRVAWRRQIASNTERSLFAAVIPAGPVHVDLVNSMALASDGMTMLMAGFMSSLPLDYFLRASGRNDLRVGEAKTLPAPTAGHPLAFALLLRTLRLSAQTNVYAPLWSSLYDESWAKDVWAAAPKWPTDTTALAEGIGPTWAPSTPLRTEFTRRAALVEIDALVAVWLGISADELVAMYDARFPVLQQYEENMWFDATGRRIAKAHQVHGYGQPRDAWKQLSAHPDFPEGNANVPEGYTSPLYQANRRKELRAAHAEFVRRMAAVGWEPGQTKAGTRPARDEAAPAAE